MYRILCHFSRWTGLTFALLLCFQADAQTTTVRVIAANLNGNTQSYQPFALRILQGLTPDVVAIQEFNYTSTNGLGVNTPAAFREMIDTALGTNYVYFREDFNSGGDIPNGIISRYPIIAAGSWADTVQSAPNRGYAWAQIALPGTNTLYVVSVHLLTSSSSVRASEATNLKALMQANLPANAFVVLAGDFNTGSRSEAAMVTFDSYLSDNPIPVDDVGNSDTSANRNNPHDYVLPSFSFTNKLTPVIYPGHTYPNGLVFDSRVYSVAALVDFAPVQQPDSGLAQHMAVVKDFLVFGTSTNSTGTAPSINTQPQSQTVAQGGSVTFSVSATGSPSPSYQWLFYGTNLNGATSLSFSITNVAFADGGPYSVVVTNASGSITSSVATLTVTNGAPIISTQPQSQAVTAGQNATFTVGASGSGTLTYQWRLNGTNISTATGTSYTRFAVQASDAGNYSVVVSNSAGTATSADAALTILTGSSTVIAQWNFNTTNAATINSPVPSLGTGTITVIGGTAGSWVTGTGSVDTNTPNNAWNTTPYPGTTSGNKVAGAQFAVSTLGRKQIRAFAIHHKWHNFHRLPDSSLCSRRCRLRAKNQQPSGNHRGGK